MDGYIADAFVTLSNTLGQRVMTDHISFENGPVEKQYTIQLVPGIYLLQINDGSEVISEKLLIE
jgi:hypothetical protein